MFFKSKLTQSFCSGIVCFIFATMVTGCDESYDLSKLGGDITLFENGISAPLEKEVSVTLSDLLTTEDTKDLITVDSKGRYALNFSGAIDPVQLDIPEVAYDAINPEIDASFLNFFDSFEKDPVIGPLLEQLGYDGGPLPESPYLVIPEDVVHAVIADAKEEYNFTIDDVPEEVVAIHSIKLQENSVATLSLHADGFPKDITHVTFEFILHAPSQMNLIPVEEDIWVDDKGYFHILHDLPCINGELDDEVHFAIEGLTFEPALERTADNTIYIESELEYYGAVHINESFNLSGWTPQFHLHVGFTMDSSTITEVSGTVQAQIDGFEQNVQLGELPEVLTNPQTRLDLQQVLFQMNIDNNIPLGVNADLELQSNFYDGTSSPLITTDEPLQILGNTQQKLVVTNDAGYADGAFTLIENLEELVDKVPQSVNIKVNPFVPVTDVTLQLGTTYSLALDYALSVPIVLGENLNLYYEVEISDFAQTLHDITSYVDCAKLVGAVESTLPIDVSLTLYAIDKNGNIVNDAVKMSDGLKVLSNKTTPFSLQLDLATDKQVLDRVDKVILAISGKCSKVGELRPEQYLKITDLSLHLPEGATLVEEL